MIKTIYVGLTREYTSLYDAVLDSSDGTTIIIDEGEYVEDNQIELPIGVNVIGVGDVTITTNYESSDNLDAFLLLESGDTGEYGNQTIKNITFDGELVANICALVWCRNDVVFQNCTVKNFTDLGVLFKTVNSWSEPTFWATGNVVKNCTFSDCSAMYTFSKLGAIQAFGQSGFEVYGNTFYLEDRDAGYNGNIMMMSWVKGFKYYDNVSYKSTNEGEEGDDWNMGLEIWNSLGGNEVYNNEFNGGGNGSIIDIAGTSNTKGDYEYSWWVHHNTFQVEEQGVFRYGSTGGVAFESTNKDAIVNYNHFINIHRPFSIAQSQDQEDCVSDNIVFHHNLCENIGDLTTTYGCFVLLGNAREDGTIQNVYIYNNTFKGYNIDTGFKMRAYGTIKGIYIYNNIIEGVREYDVSGSIFGWLYIYNLQLESPSEEHIAIGFSNIYIRNNIIYDNVNDNAICYGDDVVVESLVQENNLNSDPKYVIPYTDFHLQESSPAIGSGIDVGLSTDLDGNEVGNPPCIGVYEYVS